MVAPEYGFYSRREFLRNASVDGAALLLGAYALHNYEQEEKPTLGRHLSTDEVSRLIDTPNYQSLILTESPLRGKEYFSGNFTMPRDGFVYGSMNASTNLVPGLDIFRVRVEDRELKKQQNWETYVPLPTLDHESSSNFQLGYYQTGEYAYTVHPVLNHSFAKSGDVSLSFFYADGKSFTETVYRHTPLIEPIDWGSPIVRSLEGVLLRRFHNNLRHQGVLDMFVEMYERGAKFKLRALSEYLTNYKTLIKTLNRPTDVDDIVSIEFSGNPFDLTGEAKYFKQTRIDKIRHYHGELIEGTRPVVQMQWPNNNVTESSSNGPFFAPIPSIMSLEEVDAAAGHFAEWQLWVMSLMDLGVSPTSKVLAPILEEHDLILPDNYMDLWNS